MKCNSTFKHRHENINNCHNFPFMKLLLSGFMFLNVRRAHLPRELQLLSENQDKAVSCSPEGYTHTAIFWVFISALHTKLDVSARVWTTGTGFAYRASLIPFVLHCPVPTVWGWYWTFHDKKLTVILGMEGGNQPEKCLCNPGHTLLLLTHYPYWRCRSLRNSWQCTNMVLKKWSNVQINGSFS